MVGEIGMLEIYLISVLDGLKIFLGLISGLLIIVFIAKLFSYHNYGEDKDNEDRARFLIVGIALILINIFTPSTKQAYLIWGVGSTIDYLKDNEAAKQLPGKAVIALDRWLDLVSDTTKDE